MVTAESVPKRVDGAEVAAVGSQAVLLDGEGATARGLNPTGAKVWELIDGVRSVAAIAEVLAKSVHAPPGVVERDVLQFVTALVNAKVLRVD